MFIRPQNSIRIYFYQQLCVKWQRITRCSFRSFRLHFREWLNTSLAQFIEPIGQALVKSFLAYPCHGLLVIIFGFVEEALKSSQWSYLIQQSCPLDPISQRITFLQTNTNTCFCKIWDRQRYIFEASQSLA